jgi:RES domain-containing protein
MTKPFGRTENPLDLSSSQSGPGPPQAWQARRIANARFDVFGPIGALLVGGRWNSPGLGVIYASRSYAGAMLECLAHAGIGRRPQTHTWRWDRHRGRRERRWA